MTKGHSDNRPITYHQALAVIRCIDRLDGAENISLDEACNRVLAAPVIAPIPSPLFTNSAMDGFALKTEDVRAGGPLRILGDVFAGVIEKHTIPAYERGGCVRIMTGGVLPDWADTVVPVERAKESAGFVTFSGTVLADQNIRHVGEDISAGDNLLAEGTFLDPHRLMLLANFGLARISVLTQPQVLLLSTGDELVQPGEPLRPGAIYNSSRTFLYNSAVAAGIPILGAHQVQDNEEEFTNLIARKIDFGKPQFIVSTGAVSAGDKDFIPQVGKALGFEALFHKVAIRPGKPVYFARKGQVYWIGLPGNPISTAVGWQFFVRPFLEAWAGLPSPRRFQVELAGDVPKPEALRAFFRATVTSDNMAHVHGMQGSAHFQASRDANAIVELPEGADKVPAGTKVEAVFI